MRRILLSLALVAAFGSAPSRAATPGGLVVAPATMYVPTSVTIARGTQLQFANVDDISHSLTDACFSCTTPRFDTGLIGFGRVVAVAGTEKLAPGTYAFNCILHAGIMRGSLVVA